jgi:arabinofuranan 3-O-arabinosyltransferase
VSQPSYLIVNENFNAGWQAVLQQRSLQPVRLDGWKQGWLLPAGSRGLVTLTYRPDGQYRAAVFAGLGALGLILLLAAAPVRRRQVVVPPRDGRRAGMAMPAGEPSAPSRPAVMRGWALCLAVLLTGLLGLWSGGYAGAALLPAMTIGFMIAITRRPRSRLAAVLAEPWLIAVLLVIGAACGAVGSELFAHGIGGAALAVLGGVIPELACLAIVGRIITAVLVPEA